MTYKPFLMAIRHYGFFWIVLLILILFNFFFYTGIVRGKKEEVISLQKKYMETRRKIMASQGDNAIMKRYIKAKRALHYFRMTLPRENEQYKIIDDLNQIMEKTGFHGIKISLEPREIVALLLLKYTIEIDVKGSYAKLKKLLAGIQNSSQLYCIEKLAFENKPDGDGKVRMELMIATYFRGSMRMQLQPLAR